MKKRILAILLAAALLVAFAGCQAGKGDGKTKITLCLDWTPNTNHTGFYVAQEKGYFEEAGIELTIVQPPENGAAAMCAAGQAQFAIDAQDTLAPAFARSEPLAVTAIAALIQHNTSGIISRKGEGMDTPKGLEGKTYATWDNPTEQAILTNIMAADGGDFSKVNLIPNKISDEAGALREKLTDAIWVYYAWGGIATELSGLDFDYFNLKDENNLFDYYTPILIGNNDYLEKNPQQVTAFLNAVKKGYAYAIANPEEAAQILIAGDTTGSLKDSEQLVLASQKWLADHYIADAQQWGYIAPERWDRFYTWLSDNNLVEQPLPAGTGYTNEYLSYTVENGDTYGTAEGS